MLRQRVRVERSTLVVLGQLVTVLIAVALVWYGLILGLLAIDVLSAGAANAVTGYRTLFDELAALGTDDVDGVVRLFTGIGGLLAFLVFGWLAFKQVPRPQLARGELLVAHDDDGEVTLAPRAFERAAESAALGNDAVTGAAGRYGGDDVSVDITVNRATDVADTLRDVQRRVRLALEPPRASGRPGPRDRHQVRSRKEPELMNDQRFAALLGFAFAAAWVGFGFGEAVLCLVGAAAFYAVARFMAGELEMGDVRERVEGARSGFRRPRSTQEPTPQPRPTGTTGTRAR